MNKRRTGRLSWYTLFVCVAQLTSQWLHAEDIDFRHDFIPALTKHGCNAGACHGAAIGRGGLKLSLYGGDPQADYDAIVRQLQGRRINLAEPERSLLLLKPTEQLDHGGGGIFDSDEEAARLMRNWIHQGASDQATRQLRRVSVSPRRYVAQAAGDVVQLQVVAHYTDGSQRDVTRWTVFHAEDPSAVQIQAPAKATILRRGRHIVVARYLHSVVPIELVVPFFPPHTVATDSAADSYIDAHVQRTLAELGLESSPPAEAATYLRRVTLDLTGRLPKPEQIRAFTTKRFDAASRRAQVDALLDSPEFNEFWTHWLAELLRLRPPRGDQQSAKVYHRWLAEQIQQNVSYRQLARALLMADGDTHVVGPASFYRTTVGPREQAEFFSELFMGSRLRCANCHNHPLDRWTQDDYHGLAAIFAGVDGAERIVRDKPGGTTIHPRTKEPATPRIPGAELAVEQASDHRKPVGRSGLADWLTSPDNPYFAKAIVNRLWRHMFGRGLVEPVDDFRDTNPATHPALLDQLARDFVDHGYDIRHTLGVIACSETYARSGSVTPRNRDDDRFYSHALRRPLPPAVLADAISDVLGVHDRYGSLPIGTRAIAIVDPGTPSTALDVLGRCDRQTSCESSVSPGGLAEKLHLFNGDLLNARLADEDSRLQRMLHAGDRPEKIITAFYDLSYGRPPSSAELQHWLAQVQQADDVASLLEDFVWGILASREFNTNH